METTTNRFTLDVAGAAERLKKIVVRTPLVLNQNLSRRYQCSIFLKREDLQVVRSYKIRGAYNMMSSFPAEVLQKGLVCASAGNHAQGFAYSCKKLNVKGVVFMPIITPKQKVDQTRMFGENFVDIKLIGDTFDDCAVAAKRFTTEHQMVFIPPFEDLRIIEGQATVALEILEEPVRHRFSFCTSRRRRTRFRRLALISRPIHLKQRLSVSNQKVLRPWWKHSKRIIRLRWKKSTALWMAQQLKERAISRSPSAGKCWMSWISCRKAESVRPF